MDRPECPIPYISRTLIVDRGTQDEKAIKEEEIAQFTNRPLIVLGEPGIGKTELTKSIERLTGGHRISAGTFSRSENLEKLGGPSGSPLIIDGLDEVSASATGSALDDVLRKLDRMGRPNFVVSCRAADWRGSADRYKIEQDYGVAPVTLHLQPFSHEEALAFLHQFDSVIDGEKLLDEISRRGLSELAGNPLTLRLVAEVVRENGELPASKADLLERASRLLVTEENPAHAASPNAQASVDDLLLSAGGIFAHLLISGSLGVSAEQREHLREGFVHLAAFVGILNAPFVTDVIGTRLFVSEGEGRFIPVHRVVAEYLGGRWLSERLKQGLSERRLFQALHISEGVPGPLRGLHAWLGHFNASVADRCIRADPYGVLRYGEPDNHEPVRACSFLWRTLVPETFENFAVAGRWAMHRLLISAAVIVGISVANPALANWWIVRSSDEKCLVVDIEPTGKDKSVTKVGKDVYQTAEQAEADIKRLCKENSAK